MIIAGLRIAVARMELPAVSSARRGCACVSRLAVARSGEFDDLCKAVHPDRFRFRQLGIRCLWLWLVEGIRPGRQDLFNVLM